MTSQNQMEPLLNPSNNRLTLFPIQYQNIWEMYEKMEASFWTSKEIDWSKDKHDFKRLNENEQRFIKYVLAFFSVSDTIVNMNLGERLSQDVQLLEAKMVYQFQMMIENIHAQTYSLQIENILDDPEEKNAILNAIETVPCIKKKTSWMMKWITSTDSYPIRLVAQAIAEGVFFSGSFCAIFWLKQKNIMPGLISSNELIARDEGMHCDFSILLYHQLNHKLSQETIYQMFKDAIEIEREFICESLPCSLLGMNADLMEQYIKFVADRLILQLGYEKLYHVENPFTWMEAISIEGKTNFFEYRPTQYQRAEVLNETKQQAFEVSDDF